MFKRFSSLIDVIHVSHNIANAVDNGRKPKPADLRKLGLSQDRIKRDFC